MDMPDYYALLEIDRDAGRAEIRQAFRRLALASHPDLHPENPAQVSLFQRIQEAHEVLSDPDRRARYDALLDGKEIERADILHRPSFEEWVAAYHAGR